MRNMLGRIEVKGLCYEDLVAILTTNGYDVQVTVKATLNNATNNTYIIDYYEHKEEIPFD